MPCYSRTPVRFTSKMQGLEKVKEAAEALGYEVYLSGNYLNVTHPTRGDTITYEVRGEYIIGDSYDNERTVKEMTLAIQKRYAEIKIRDFAKTNNYNVVKGQKAGQFDLVQRQTVSAGINYRR